jgi:hypothetical protein
VHALVFLMLGFADRRAVIDENLWAIRDLARHFQ